MTAGSAPAGRHGRLKVLHLIKVLEVGGAEQLVLSLSGAGDQCRFDYHVAHVLAGGSEAFARDFVAAGVKLHDLGASSHYDLRWAARLRRLLADQSFDVIHLHLPYTASIGRLVACTAPADRRPKIVHTQHNSWKQTKPLVRALHSGTYSLDDADVAVSHAVHAALPRRLAARTEVLVHGLPVSEPIDPVVARREVRAEFAVADSEVLVVTIANLRKEKGYDVLLPAARSLVDSGFPVHFVAVGHGPLDAEIRSRRDSLGLSEHFVLTGYRSDARRILAGADIFVLASHFEGFPLAVMEALSEGVPVVSTSVGDVPNVVDGHQAGIVVPRADPVALADALAQLIADPSLRAELAVGAKVAGTVFDIRIAARRIEEIYESLVRPGGSEGA